MLQNQILVTQVFKQTKFPRDVSPTETSACLIYNSLYLYQKLQEFYFMNLKQLKLLLDFWL